MISLLRRTDFVLSYSLLFDIYVYISMVSNFRWRVVCLIHFVWLLLMQYVWPTNSDYVFVSNTFSFNRLYVIDVNCNNKMYNFVMLVLRIIDKLSASLETCLFQFNVKQLSMYILFKIMFTLKCINWFENKFQYDTAITIYSIDLPILSSLLLHFVLPLHFCQLKMCKYAKMNCLNIFAACW